jgi:hypothetical protein
VDKLREEIRQVEDQLSKLQPYDPDRISVKNELQVCSFVLS